ncbi:MAG: DUF998 domain-containing protein [Alphaproteobacteria bacterium]|nr:DUF998 domain-containing protein [Alphaproteobacteria bacterium]
MPLSNAPLARVCLAASGVSLLALVALHAVSPELDPAWRMVSEYADGRAPVLLSVFFLAWAVSSWALAAALWVHGGSRVLRVGTVLVALSGVGEAMGGLFDIHHPLHGAAFGLGVPTLALGAVLVGASLGRQQGAWLLAVSQLPWLSIVAMAGSFAVCFSTAEAAGVELSPDAKPWDAVPDGVIAVMGWANRLLVVAYLGWATTVAGLLARGPSGVPADVPAA